MTEAQTAEASGITGLMLIGVALIPWITLAISEVLLALYRRARQVVLTAKPGAAR